MISLVDKRRAIRHLLDGRSPVDGMAVYYAFHHEDDRTSIVIEPDSERPDRAAGYAAVSRTGIDLFRPLITTRLPINDLETSANLLKKALPTGAEAFIVAPQAYGPLIQAVYDVKVEQKLALYTFPTGMPDPIINIFVTRDDQQGYPRFVINREMKGRRVTASSAGVNWLTPEFGEITVRTRSEFRRRGFGKSVVSTLARHLIETGRRPIYAVNETNFPSIRLAQQIGFRDSGYRQLMYEVVAK